MERGCCYFFLNYFHWVSKDGIGDHLNENVPLFTIL